MDAENMDTWDVYRWIVYADSVGHHLSAAEVEAFIGAVEEELGKREDLAA